jgi:hypothetical protein
MSCHIKLPGLEESVRECRHGYLHVLVLFFFQKQQSTVSNGVYKLHCMSLAISHICSLHIKIKWIICCVFTKQMDIAVFLCFNKKMQTQILSWNLIQHKSRQTYKMQTESALWLESTESLAAQRYMVIHQLFNIRCLTVQTKLWRRVIFDFCR